MLTKCDSYYTFPLQAFSYYASQLTDGALKIMQPHEQRPSYLAENILWIINAGSILIALPLINHVIIPLWPTVNMKLKLGVGFVIHILSFGIAGFIQWREGALEPQQFFYWMILPTIFFSVGETTVGVSGKVVVANCANFCFPLPKGFTFLVICVHQWQWAFFFGCLISLIQVWSSSMLSHLTT